MARKYSQRNQDNFTAIKHHNMLANSVEEIESPEFTKPTEAYKGKLMYKTPNNIPLDQIVIINNNDYLDKLQPPMYKLRGTNRNPETRGHSKLNEKNSKSEERPKNEIASRYPNKLKMNVSPELTI